jgi:uncharacterized protein (DUF433 family)
LFSTFAPASRAIVNQYARVSKSCVGGDGLLFYSYRNTASAVSVESWQAIASAQMMTAERYIEHSRSGTPRIVGTVIGGADIASWVALGSNPAEIVAAFPNLSIFAVHEALRYYMDNREAIQRNVVEQEAWFTRERDELLRYIRQWSTPAETALAMPSVLHWDSTTQAPCRATDEQD